jgi:GDP/UDP-N,N'-diacetylbacillosamine 2-epimerase (hydrolysing)
MSDILFTSTEEYKKRAAQIVAKNKKIYNVGALSIDVLKKATLFSVEELKNKYGIDFSKPTVLSTFHPETVSYKKNRKYIHELIEVWRTLLAKNYQIVITKPNADTTGEMIRKEEEQFASSHKNVFIIESFGIIGYLSAMKNCRFLLGNSSSGFVEAAYFPKPVLNIGDRQKGRIITENIKSVEIDKAEILNAITEIESAPPPIRPDIYGNGNAAEKIITILKNEL